MTLSADSFPTDRFYGLTIAQAYVYFRSQEKDPKWTTWMAGIVMYVISLNYWCLNLRDETLDSGYRGLETIHTAFFLQQMIFYLDYWTYLWWLVILPPVIIL